MIIRPTEGTFPLVDDFLLFCRHLIFAGSASEYFFTFLTTLKYNMIFNPSVFSPIPTIWPSPPQKLTMTFHSRKFSNPTSCIPFLILNMKPGLPLLSDFIFRKAHSKQSIFPTYPLPQHLWPSVLTKNLLQYFSFVVLVDGD